MNLAKPAIDVGLFTNQRDELLTFWQRDIGLPFDEMLPVGDGVQQHRHRIGQSVVKINHCRATLAQGPVSGYRGLRIATPGLTDVRALRDPDGNPVTLIPPGLDQVDQIELTVAARSVDAHVSFYEDILGLARIDPRRFRCGESILAVIEDPAAGTDPTLRAIGYRYITIQVQDVVLEHQGILNRGGQEGRAPARLGEVAHISFVKDPDGNWIEISQRKSLTGTLDSGAGR